MHLGNVVLGDFLERGASNMMYEATVFMSDVLCTPIHGLMQLIVG